MAQSWCILTNRMGVDVRSPSDGDLQLALKDVWGIADSEHPNSWLRFGCDNGRMYVLDVYTSGTVIFSQWADEDFETELAPEGRRTDISFENTLRLWRALRQGDISTVVGEGWK